MGGMMGSSPFDHGRLILRSGHFNFDSHYTVIMGSYNVAQSSPHRSDTGASVRVPASIYYTRAFCAALLHESSG